MFKIPHEAEKIDFLYEYLLSKEIKTTSIRKALTAGGVKPQRAKNKTELAQRVKDGLNKSNAENILTCLAEEIISTKKTWCAVYQTNTTPKTEIKTSDKRLNFLYEKMDRDEVFGPFERGSETWCILPQYVLPTIDTSKEDPEDEIDKGNEDNNTPQPEVIRWICCACIQDGYTSFHWDGFSYQDSYFNSGSFPFWKTLPISFNNFFNTNKIRATRIELESLFMHKVWGDFYNSDEHHWKHIRIRAHSEGISLNAHESKSATVDLDIKGIQGFAEKLAQTVMQSLDIAQSQKNKSKAVDATIKLIMKEWGTISYEFELKHITKDETKVLFLGHCYFGKKVNVSKKGDKDKKVSNATQDSMPHIKTYKGAFGSFLVKDFVIEQHLSLNAKGKK